MPGPGSQRSRAAASPAHSQDTTTGVAATAARSVDSVASEGSAVTSTADIAYFFTVKDPTDPTVKRYCIHCRNKHQEQGEHTNFPVNYTFSWKTSNTPLRQHLERLHKDKYLEEAAKGGWLVQLPSSVNLRKAATEKVRANAQAIERVPFSFEEFANRLVRWIVADDQSIYVVESRQFRDLLLFLRPELKEEEVPHRTKVRTTIVEMWQSTFLHLKSELESALGLPSFTMDLWSSKNRSSFMCITVHYMTFRDPSKKEGIMLKTDLLAFHKLGGKHSGTNIAATVAHLLTRVGIDPAKRMFWTCDNAGNNGTFIEAFVNKHRPNDINPRELLVACFPHVINLCAQRAIRVLNKGPTDDESDSEAYEDDDEEASTTPARPTTVLAKVRSIIRSIRSSSQRIESFKSIVINGNQLEWWRDEDDEPITIKPLQLLRDVKTRWDSTYQMLCRFREVKEPLKGILAGGSRGSRTLKDLTKFALNDEEWDRIDGFIAVLRHPHEVLLYMAQEKMPVLAGAIPLFEKFMTKLEALRDKEKDLYDAITACLEVAYKYYDKMDNTDAYIVAMFVHPGFRMRHIEKHWSQDFVATAKAKILSLLRSYREAGPASTPAQANPKPRTAQKVPGWVNYVRTKYDDDEESESDSQNDTDADASASNDETVEKEYKRWVTGSRSIGLDIDLCQFWELNRAEYPTIFKLAMDYLPVQASSVPSERVFSSSAETDTVRRNRISPVLMEALQMVKFKIRHEGPFNMTHLRTSEEDMARLDPGFGRQDLLADLSASVGQAEIEGVRAMDRVVRAVDM